MYDPDDGQYDALSTSDAESGENAGVLGPTLRNAAILIGVSLAVAWGVGQLGELTSAFGVQTAAVPAPAARLDPASAPQVLPQQEGGYRLGDANSAGGYELRVPPGPNGHFFLEAQVNGADVRFLVDTGASTVMLTNADARRVGYAPGRLDFRARIRTANGEIAAAPVMIERIRLGRLELENIRATVTDAPLDVSLLGMSFLKRLASYEVREEGLILRW